MSENTQSVRPSKTQTATVAAGCFWGIEHLYQKHFGGGKGVTNIVVGYTGGETSAPTYRRVASGTTGHTESVRLTFDPTVVSYHNLLEFFYRIHDPTVRNAQGPDQGTQYRSAIYYENDEQEKIAKEVTEQVAQQWYPETPIVTEIMKLGEWYDAEEYHQRYMDNTPGAYHCPAHKVRPFPALVDTQ